MAVPLWDYLNKILNMNHEKGTTMEPMGNLGRFKGHLVLKAGWVLDSGFGTTA